MPARSGRLLKSPTWAQLTVTAEFRGDCSARLRAPCQQLVVRESGKDRFRSHPPGERDQTPRAGGSVATVESRCLSFNARAQWVPVQDGSHLPVDRCGFLNGRQRLVVATQLRQQNAEVVQR